MITLIGDFSEEMKTAANTAFDLLLLNGEGAVEVAFVSKNEIRALNAQTRNVDRVTDVLSFPMLDVIKPFCEENYKYDYDANVGAVLIGSIVICREVASEQAEEYGHSVRREETYLFTHGLLHLLGYDHMTDEDKKVMREREESILGAMGITR